MIARKSIGIALVISLLVIFGCGEEKEIVREEDGAKMVLIPAGEFSMGDHHGDVSWIRERATPVHKVYLDAYYIDVYEVTNAQYAKFLNEYGKNEDAKGHKLFDIGDSDFLIEKVGNTYKPKSGYENHPVIEVSWYGAAAYAQFYGKRLPTESEWEKAARGGLVGKKYPWGDTIDQTKANYDSDNSRGWTTVEMLKYLKPVGSFPVNNYGLHDMAGNVWEWCADEYDSGYYSNSPKDNPRGPGTVITFRNDDLTNVATRRVFRGGCWGYNNAYYLRCAGRLYSCPAHARSDVGFRCSQDL